MREDEAQIAGALGQRYEPLVDLGRHGDLVYSVGRLRVIYTRRPAIHPAARNRNHHDAGGASFATPSVGRFAQRMPQQELLEKYQRSRSVVRPIQAFFRS